MFTSRPRPTGASFLAVAVTSGVPEAARGRRGRSCDERGGGEENGREAAGVAPKMADQIPLHPVPRSTQRRAAYYTSAATAQRHNRYEQGRHGGFPLFLPPIVSNGG